jgi:hypothetical protein
LSRNILEIPEKAQKSLPPIERNFFRILFSSGLLCGIGDGREVDPDAAGIEMGHRDSGRGADIRFGKQDLVCPRMGLGKVDLDTELIRLHG